MPLIGEVSAVVQYQQLNAGGGGRGRGGGGRGGEGGGGGLKMTNWRTEAIRVSDDKSRSSFFPVQKPR